MFCGSGLGDLICFFPGVAAGAGAVATVVAAVAAGAVGDAAAEGPEWADFEAADMEVFFGLDL